jgi:hypothetical protein
MSAKRKQRRRPTQAAPAALKHDPLNPPTKTFVVMRYEVRTPPGMQPEWIERETGEMDEGYARVMLENTLAELAASDENYPLGAPIRDPYLVRVTTYEEQLTPRLEDARRRNEARQAEHDRLRAALAAHLDRGGAVELGGSSE